MEDGNGMWTTFISLSLSTLKGTSKLRFKPCQDKQLKYNKKVSSIHKVIYQSVVFHLLVFVWGIMALLTLFPNKRSCGKVYVSTMYIWK